MKKFRLLFLGLVSAMCLGAYAEDVATVTAPVAGQAYALKNVSTNLYFKIGETNTLSKDASPVFFEAVGGDYVLCNSAKQYVYKTTEDTWTLSVTSSIADAYKVQLNNAEGGFTMDVYGWRWNSSASQWDWAANSIGSDGTDDGAVLYADKTALNNGVWTLEVLAQTPAQELANAKEAKKAEINALPAGDGAFQYTSANVNAALAAVEAATTVEAVKAITVAQNAPAKGQAYILLNTTANNYELSVSANGITIEEDGTPVYFEAVNGGYAISNGSEYVNYAGSDAWTMTASSTAYAWTIAPSKGGYTLTGMNGLLGTNSNETEAGSPCYGDKSLYNGNCVWAIMEYATPTPDPEPMPFPEPEPSVIADVTYAHGSVVAASNGKVNITYTRNFAAANKWQSLYVPFAIDMAKVQDDIVIAKVDDVVEENGVITINIVKASASDVIDAKTPLFIAAKTAGDKAITVGTSAIVEPEDDATYYRVATFYGVLAGKKAGIDGNYIMSNGSLYYVPASMASVKLGVNHWYMEVLSSNNVEAKIRINAEGFNSDEATAIADAVAESVEDGEIFSINGAKVNDAKSGLYIKGGKKILVK